MSLVVLVNTGNHLIVKEEPLN